MSTKRVHFAESETTHLLGHDHYWGGHIPEKSSFQDSKYFVLVIRSIFLLIAFIFFTGIYFLPPPSAPPGFPESPASIAIIGAGPAGIAAASTLNRLSRQKKIPINVTIYEQKHAIGGRLVLSDETQTTDVFPFNDHTQAPIEPEDLAGPSLLYSSKILSGYAKSLGWNPQFHDRREHLGIFDGKNFIFEGLRPSSAEPWMSWLGEIYRYGASIWRSVALPVGAMNKLETLPKLPNSRRFPFADIQGVVNTLNLEIETRSSAEQYLKVDGISKKYEEEVILPQVRKRLAQDIQELNALSLAIAMYDGDQGVSKAGGLIVPILEDMAFNSGADLKLGTRVNGSKPELMPSGKWVNIIRSERDTGEVEYAAYDQVIFATPDESPMDPENKLNLTGPHVEYRPRHITLFTSRRALTGSFFGHRQMMPSQIITTVIGSKADCNGIHEIAHVKNVARVLDDELVTEHLYRILSAHEISDDFLNAVLDSHEDQGADNNTVTWVYRNEIPFAYPLLYPRKTFPPLMVSDSLWHTSAIDAFANTIDTSLFMGANVAALVIQKLEDQHKYWDIEELNPN
ncbi:MAG: hypothetical protein M1834_009199 [Cirrosporium novae-zelandiae]|nr:MAG: hypothetical protein M1834_009199 [Cirrosporium novae-zelandiae]